MQGSLFGHSLMSDEDRLAAIDYHWQQVAPHMEAIKDLKDSCPHNNVKRVHKSDTGNWCPQDDSYWDECSCSVCGNFWKENYRDGYSR